MFKRFYWIILLVFLSTCAFAQVQEVNALAGVNVPMYKGVESDAVVSVNYGWFNRQGLGFHIGAQWIPSVSGVDNAFGVPVSFSYRIPSRTTHERLESAASGAVSGMVYDTSDRTAGEQAKQFAGGFLMNLFSDMEFFVGLTPGYVAGMSSSHTRGSWGDSWQYWEEDWTEKKDCFSLSIDAGMCLNYSIWKFDIKVMPAFHYNVMRNYIYHKSSGEVGADTVEYHDKPLRWTFTLCAGLAFRF